MSKGIDVSLDEIIQKSRKQHTNYAYKKYVNPKLKDYGDYQKNYNQYDRNRQNIRKKRIIFNRRDYTNNNYKINDKNYEKKTDPRYSENDNHEENKSYEREKRERYEEIHSQRRRFPEIRKTSETERSSSPEIQRSKTRLKISNLHKGITNSELFQLFSDIGNLKRCGIHWDNLGNSLGTADIEYIKPEDAKKAIEDYNNAEVEGLEMKVEYAETRNKVDLNERIKRIRLKKKDNNYHNK